ncbi:proteoglycan 4-like [Harmonia axyridis]|uniref:proteoglycan 4-like n=1 Tax=Harmonia axyridis TaxID=115357 RepID=UPI001E275D7D|nr:proteoglycan 4-like [Harmonia axyridis]
MSKKIQPPKSRPGSAGAPRPRSAGIKPVASKTSSLKPPSCPMAAEKLKKQKKEKPAEAVPKIYENPAFSIPLKKVETNPLLADKDKKKTIRRNIPQGEDTKGIKSVLQGLKDSPDVTVAEFIGLVAPYTGDNAEVLRAVLTDDMNSFRAMARKIYDTMTQDVSDVLTNQHIQLREYEQERTTIYTEKMMRAINEIFAYAPNFDFEAYYEDKKGYLNRLFPVPKLLEPDSDEAEMHRRQQAFHRLNWLRTEGDRLSAENERLHQRLKELKHEQMEEIKQAEEREAEAEAKRIELEAQEAAVQKQLEALTDKVEETMIDTEAAMRVAVDEANITAPKKAAAKGPVKRRMKKKPAWVSDNAAEIEEKAIEENLIADGGQVQPENLAGVIKKVRSKASKTRIQRPTTPEKGPAPTQEKSPFHFSPIKTPPSRAPPQTEKSPFHYSPPPEVRVQAPESPAPAPKPPQLHTTRLRTEKVTVRQRSPQPKAFLVPPGGGGASGTPHRSLLEPGGDDITPTYQKLQTTTPLAPRKVGGTLPTQKPTHSKIAMPQTPRPVERRGRAGPPKDTWGGFG